MTPQYAPEVAQARAAGQPIVALESTIITHGMPWPQNLEMAGKVEDTIRAEGAVPATIAVRARQLLGIGALRERFQLLRCQPHMERPVEDR
ncbi:MAG: pseudouridine-5'-phosphate glycosidase, partial [Pseudomonadota bacterium]